MRKSRLDINDPEAPADIETAFARAEAAPVTNGVVALEAPFRDGPKRQSRTPVRLAEGRRVVAAHVNLVPE